MNCEICKKELVSLKSLSQHLLNHNISSKFYYDNFFLKNENEKYCSFCGNETKFKNISLGYQKYCSLKCSNNSLDRIEKFKISLTDEKLNIAKEKRKKTNKQKYGVDVPFSYGSEEFKNNIIKKYKTDNMMKLKEVNIKAVESRYKYQREKVVKIILKNENLEIDPEYNGAHLEYTFTCKICKTSFNTIWNYVQCGKRCPNCYPTNNGTSRFEIELKEFLNEINIEKVVYKTKKIIGPKELDIFLPDYNVAIEFDGLYWHSDDKLDINYHVNKTNLCKDKNIRLIHIFEDEWLFKKSIVKKRIEQILNKNKSKIIYARNCTIKEIDSKTKNNFLEKFHLQGIDSSNIKLGAFYNDILISIMTFSHGNISKGSKSEEDIWELNRFCIDFNYRVIGIAGKLLEYFKRNYKWKQIFSYADRRWSQGNVYYKLDFELDHITKPNYWYIKGYNRIHRFNLRKLPDEAKDIPEYILRKEQGYQRIWDCGNLKFTMVNN